MSVTISVDLHRYLSMKKYILIILLFCSLNLFSQNISIKGKIESQRSKVKGQKSLVRLMTYNDMLTCEQAVVYETSCDAEGNFVIKTDIDEITPAQIAVGLERVDLILKPNSEYEVVITIPQQDENSSYFERQSPTLKMIRVNDDELYYQYYKVETLVDDFVLENFNQLYKRRQKSLLDSLEVLINKELGAIKSDFVNDYLRYRRANIQMVLDGDDAKNVKDKYFDAQEILYHQPAYMSLFNEIFSDYLVSRQFAPSDVLLNIRHGYDRFMTYLKSKDVFLAENKALAELVVAWNLKRMFYEYPEERKYILDCLRAVGANTKEKENRGVVEDIIKQLERLSFNTEAPQFSLRDAEGEVVNLSDYKDDFVVLQFAGEVSPMTDFQFQQLNNISQYWPDNVKIITIVDDENFSDFKQMIDENAYDWQLLNLGDDILLLEEYQIRTLPDYIVIIPGNKIGMAPASTPDQYLDYHLKRIYNHIIKK